MQPTEAVTPLLLKMATFTGAEHARCVFWFHKQSQLLQSKITFILSILQFDLQITFSIQTFLETSCSVQHGKSTGHPQVADAAAE